MEKTTATIKCPETIIGVKGYNRLDLFYRHLSPFWNWDDEDTPAKLDELIKEHNPNELEFVIPRVYGFHEIIKDCLKKHYRTAEAITEIKLPKIHVVTMTKENVLKTRNHYKNLERFYDKLGLAHEYSGFSNVVDNYLAKKTDEPLRFEVILKGTEIEVETFEPLIPCYC